MANSEGDNSSANLSLKLRRGSSDSRESFYMDFDRGIDSDIDEVSSSRKPSTVARPLIFVDSVTQTGDDYTSDDVTLLELKERKLHIQRYIH